MRTKVYAVLELWVQVCGASAGVLQGGASGEALLTHLLSDISPPTETLKVSKVSAYPRRLCPIVPFVPLCLIEYKNQPPACYLPCLRLLLFSISCAVLGGALMVCRPASPVLQRR